jgi:organic radical activating enzyme
MSALRDICDEHTSRLVAKDLLGDSDVVDDLGEWGIDHQSVYAMPLSWDGKGLDHDFAQEFRDFLLQEGLVILGGNDNDDKNHPLLSKAKGFKLPIPRDIWRGELVARKDPAGFWTLFNRRTGAKMRLRFPKRVSKLRDPEWGLAVAGEVAPTKAFAPELIDIKITDFCPHNCHFCYQGSSPNGRHAEWKNTWGLLDALKRMRVFEVAIGGGEPVLHPCFPEILRSFRAHGITPNFSTRELSWLRDPTKWHPILEAAGSFAYSIDNPDQSVEEFAAVLNAYGFRNELEKLVPQPTVHHVMIGGYGGNFKEFLRSAHRHDLHVVLLGHKLLGRAIGGKPNKDASWIDTVVELHEAHECPRLSIDTALAKTFGRKLKEAGVPDWLVETQEGKFSMYIDLVDRRMGPSSFCPEADMVALDWNAHSDKVMETILGAFSTW